MDYDGYRSGYHGTLIGSEDDFLGALARVSALLDNFTEGRIADYTGAGKDTAYYAMCEAVYSAAAQTAAEAAHAGIASEDIDGYKVSYGTASGGSAAAADNTPEFVRTMYSLARMYLPAWLFYRGVAAND